MCCIFNSRWRPSPAQIKWNGKTIQAVSGTTSTMEEGLKVSWLAWKTLWGSAGWSAWREGSLNFGCCRRNSDRIRGRKWTETQQRCVLLNTNILPCSPSWMEPKIQEPMQACGQTADEKTPQQNKNIDIRNLPLPGLWVMYACKPGWSACILPGMFCRVFCPSHRWCVLRTWSRQKDIAGPPTAPSSFTQSTHVKR